MKSRRYGGGDIRRRRRGEKEALSGKLSSGSDRAMVDDVPGAGTRKRIAKAFLGSKLSESEDAGTGGRDEILQYRCSYGRYGPALVFAKGALVTTKATFVTWKGTISDG